MPVEGNVQFREGLLHLSQPLDHEVRVSVSEHEVRIRHHEEDDDRPALGLGDLRGVQEGPVVLRPLVAVAQVDDGPGPGRRVRSLSPKLAPARLVHGALRLRLGHL